MWESVSVNEHSYTSVSRHRIYFVYDVTSISYDDRSQSNNQLISSVQLTFGPQSIGPISLGCRTHRVNDIIYDICPKDNGVIIYMAPKFPMSRWTHYIACWISNRSGHTGILVFVSTFNRWFMIFKMSVWCIYSLTLAVLGRIFPITQLNLSFFVPPCQVITLHEANFGTVVSISSKITSDFIKSKAIW